MASPQINSGPTKLSFAKVAAMPAPSSTQHASSHMNGKARPDDSIKHRKTPSAPRANGATAPAVKLEGDGGKELANSIADISSSIEGIALVKEASMAEKMPKLNSGTDSTEDDQSHVSNSSSKPQSFDTKSLASVTTFALDEKESIRPDDSASVRAAEEDDFTHGQQFITGGTHMTSEQAALAARENPRFVAQNSLAVRRYPTLTIANQPRFGDLPLTPILTSEDPRPQKLLSPGPIDEQIPHSRLPTLAVVPDEKLLDALATPKDRLPLLQLEERIIAFINQDREEILDLPPQNAFMRLLAHKMADYYSLQHHLSDDNISVRMYKTGCQSLPTPLHFLAQSIPIGPLPPPGVTTFKIMRRADLGNRQISAGESTPASSSAPSKATSEAGGENSDEGITSPLEGTPAKHRSKMTREEREANYKAARERIFGDFQESVTSEGGSAGETSASMSRSSSSSGKKKSRRQRALKDDSFEARSSYVAYPGMAVPNFQGQMSHFTEQHMLNQYPGTVGMSSGISYGNHPPQHYSGMDPTMPYGTPSPFNPNAAQQYGSGEAWPSVQSSNYGSYGHSSHPQSFGQHPGAMSSMGINHQYAPQGNPTPQQSMQNWMPPQYSNAYAQPQMNQPFPSQQWPSFGPSTQSQPYPYGQLPPHAYTNPTMYNNQHPIPGSYTRSLFNPQTRSFVPTNASSRSGPRTSRKKPANHPGLPRNNSSSNSVGSDLRQNTPASQRGEGTPSSGPSPKPREDSLQQKYGAPAHLPKKPPPSQIPSAYDIDGSTLAGSPGQAEQTRTGSAGPVVVNGA